MRRLQGYYYPRDIRRTSRRLAPKTIVCICCEGAKTEPHYFEALRRDLRLSSVCVRIIPGDICGSDPRTVVAWAADMKKDLAAEWPGAVVWCVFDRDEHPQIENALCRARDCRICLGFSNPCFELWLLLHYEYSTAQLERDEALRRLRAYIPAYAKATPVYDFLRERREQAVTHASRLREHHERTRDSRAQAKPAVNRGSTARPTDNPSTTVDELVVYLVDMA